MDWFDVAPTSYGGSTPRSSHPVSPPARHRTRRNHREQPGGASRPLAREPASSGGLWRSRLPGPAPIACSTTSPPRVSAKRSCGGCSDSKPPVLRARRRSKNVPLHHRVTTPYFRNAPAPDRRPWGEHAGQPLVRWRVDVHDRELDTDRVIEGHVEVRWSHGKFGGVPEAKIYPDTRITTCRLSAARRRSDRPQIGRPAAQRVDERVGHHSARTHASPPA